MPTLAEAQLREIERRVLQRLVSMLEREFGNDLFGVWLYGSTARGDARHEESDIDLMVVLGRTHSYADAKRALELTRQAARAEGASSSRFSTQVTDVAWVASRREIRWSFVEALERDKIVLAGPEGPVPGMPREDAMMARTEEHLARARDLQGDAGRTLAANVPSVAAATAYEAMREAALAALSARDEYARTHRGTWILFSDMFVKPGVFAQELYDAAQDARELRDGTWYRGVRAGEEEARTVLGDAERFIDAVERLLRVRHGAQAR